MADCCNRDAVLIYPCSGAADVGELSDRVARKLSKKGMGAMACLAGVGANFPGFVGAAQKAVKVITIDGCQVACAKNIMKNIGVEPASFILTDLGFKKGATEVNASAIDQAVEMIDCGGCCG